jgi:hypothetical protein
MKLGTTHYFLQIGIAVAENAREVHGMTIGH